MLTSKSNKVNTQKLESKPRVQTQMYDDSIGTTTYCMIICMKSRLTSFSYDSVIEGCISVKCQLMTVNFVGFGCQPGFRLHTSRQSFEPSYTQIQALLVFFLSFALASQPFEQLFNLILSRIWRTTSTWTASFPARSPKSGRRSSSLKTRSDQICLSLLFYFPPFQSTKPFESFPFCQSSHWPTWNRWIITQGSH